MKRIAILQHYRFNNDHTVDYDHYERYLIKFISTIFKGAKIEIIDAIDMQYPNKIDQYDLYFFPGSAAASFDKKNWIQEECQFIKTLHDKQKPMLGLCFGHQIIAQSLGGKVNKSPHKWQGGIKTYHIIEELPWMNPTLTSFKAHASHEDYIVEKPTEAIVFAENEQCPIAGLTIGNHILSFQAHPEIDNIIMERFINMRTEIRSNTPEQSKVARDSLTQKTDEMVIHNWIKTFFKQNT